MRHIILALSLFIAFPQQVKSTDFDHLYWTAIAFVGLYRLADSIYERSSQEKRKIDLFEESINTKIITSGVDPIKHLKTIKIVVQTYITALEKLAVLHQNNSSLEQQQYSMQKKSIEKEIDKFIQLEQEVFKSLHAMQQLNNEQLKQFRLTQQDKFIQKDPKLLTVTKQKNGNIPVNIVDERAKNYIKLEQNQLQPV